MIVALGIAPGLAGCERPSAATTAQAEPKGGGPPVARVEVVRPERRTVRRVTEQPGQIEACEVTPVHAKIGGYARTVAVDIGDRVKQGQVLAELAVPEFEADVQRKHAAIAQAEAKRTQAEAAVEVAQAALASAEAKVAEAQAGIKKDEAEMARWQSEYARARQLVSERAVTGSVVDEARSRAQAAEAARDATRAQVHSAESARTQARALLDQARSDVVAAASGVEFARADARYAEALFGYARIVAPFDGVITRRHVDTGHLTTPGAHGEPLFVVARFDLVTIAVDVPELYAPAVGPGDPVSIRLQALDGRTLKGQVTRTSWALDPRARTLRVEIDLPNPDGTLLPGLYAYATVVAEEHADVLTIPATALVREGSQVFCVTVRDGRATRRAIRMGLNDGTHAEILSGLDGGESVVKANAASLVDGQPVTPVAPAAKP
jgi:RND family efflux transporter MFP subunit